MSIHRIDNQGGFAAHRTGHQAHRRSHAAPNLGARMDNALASGMASAGSRNLDDPSFAGQWATKSGIWGGREYLSYAVNNYFDTKTPVRTDKAAIPPELNQADKYDLAEVFETPEEKPAEKANNKANNLEKMKTVEEANAIKNYSYVLGLRRDGIQLKDVTWDRFKQQVRANTWNYQNGAQASQSIRETAGRLFSHEYLKETVWEQNVNPVRDLFSDKPDKKIGSGIFRIGAFGLIGWNVFHHTAEAYRNARHHEDGSFGSRLETWKKTSGAFVRYGMRSLASWEVAGIGFAIGQAILPIVLGPLALGGLLIGGLFGALTEIALNPILGTGKYDANARNSNLAAAHQHSGKQKSGTPI